MPHHRRSLRKRKLPADVSSDDCDDDGDNRKRRTSLQNPQPKSERQQAALFRRLEATNAGLDIPVSSPFVPVGASVKRKGGRAKNINWRDRHGETFLHKLVTYGTVEEIEKLIRQGADVNARDYADWTALHEASLKGLPDAVECLLKAGADVNVAADGGTTPLHDGAISGCLKVVELLLQHGADASRTDKSCCTPLEVSTSDEVRSCLLDHLRRTTESSGAKEPGTSVNASYSNPKTSVVSAQHDGEQSTLPAVQYSTQIAPQLEHSALNHRDRSRETTDRSTGPFMLYGPYPGLPRLLPGTLSSLDIFRGRHPTLISPATSSRTVSASSSAVTLSSTSVGASPSTSVVALSENPESGRRVTRSGSRSTMDGGFQAGVAERRVVEIGRACKGNGNRVSSGVELQWCRGSSLTRGSDESLGCVRAALSCTPVTVYEDISDDDDDDDDDDSLVLCSAETATARPQELGPRIIRFATNSKERKDNSVNSVPSSQMSGGLATGEVCKDNHRSPFGLHSYSQTDLTGRLPAGWFKELRWKTSNCSTGVGSGTEERKIVRNGLGEFPGGGDDPKKNPTPGKCFFGGRILHGSGKAPVFGGHKDLSEELPGKSPRDVPLFSNRLIRGACPQGDSGIAPLDRKNGNSVQKQTILVRKVPSGNLNPYRVEPKSLSGFERVSCATRPSADATGGGNVVTNSSALSDSGNGLCVPSKNGCQRADVSVGGGSDESKPQGGKSEGAQSVALEKLGRDVVVFLRRAALDVRPETKPFGIRKAVGAIGGGVEHGKASSGDVPVVASSASGTPCKKKDRGLFTSDIEGLEMNGVKQRIDLCSSPVQKGSVPFPGSVSFPGSVPFSGSVPFFGTAPQKERVFDWNRYSSSSALLVDKSTMTTESEWEPNESVTRDQSLDVTPGRVMGRSTMETQTNITREVSPIAVPEPCAFQMCSGDWKTPAHPLCSLFRSSGLEKIFDDALKFRIPGSDDTVEPCEKVTTLPRLASYKTARRSRDTSDPACHGRQDRGLVGSEFVIPTGTRPVVSASEEAPAKVKIISFREKVSDASAFGSFGVGFERVDIEGSEHGCKPFGKRFKASMEMSSGRKEAVATMSSVGKNAGVRKKNTKNDRVHMEEDMPSELHSIGNEMDCGRPTASTRRAAGFGGGIAGACGSGLGKAKGQAGVAKERGDPLMQTKANVATREACSSEPPSDGDDASHSKKPSNYALWHGLCSKPYGSLEAVINNEQKKPDFPKDFERFLIATREYGTHSSSEEISAPAGLDLPLRTLFIKQEKERQKLKQEQHMRWERLLLTIEAEVVREYVEEEKRLDAFRPLVSSCSVLCQQNFCSRSHESLLDTTTQRPENSLKSRLKGLREKFLEFEEDMHFQLQNEISVLHACQVQEWERTLTSCPPANSSQASPQLCVPRVADLRCLVSAFFDKLNLYQ